MSYNIMLSGGGTGGHIFPALSIAEELKNRYPDSSILFVGAKGRMEMEKVPQAGYKIEGLWISGVQRSLTVDNLSFPFKLISSLYKSWKLIKKHKPNVVIGTGGFASGPLLFVASKMGVPTLIQEQNSYPGITNKVLSSSVDKICVAFNGLEKFFPVNKIKITGNPVRQGLLNDLTTKEKALSDFGLNSDKKTVLILGGSLGARAINNQIDKILTKLKEYNYQVIWQTGKLYYEDYKHLHEEGNVIVTDFLNNMSIAYAASDLIISRSGAGTISELCIVGKPVIFIPSPNVAEDHQTKNAQAISEKDAALLVEEKNIDAELLKKVINVLSDDETRISMMKNIKKLELPNASKEIADEVEILIKRK
ncbi:MAG: undecaprenyldiphospho-muramoylpentapeptide beta-N-acetylglucosaminyltransferase [Ichthyobacteriaceae bacterium]|nr:undecaprenyldiphospho-muramoylpentapeptide beta-N-acetylglucosaminyltransferase [Ichthyobacteriaceae bacterium]